MQNRYTNAVLTIIALCLLWISVKDFIITRYITKTQLETVLEASDAEMLRVHGEPATFTMPVRGSVEAEVTNSVLLQTYRGMEPIPVKLEDVGYGVSVHTYR